MENRRRVRALPNLAAENHQKSDTNHENVREPALYINRSKALSLEDSQMEIRNAAETAFDKKMVDWSPRGAMRFGLTVGILTVTAMLFCIYASALITLVS
jgi:hypothetical protein